MKNHFTRALSLLLGLAAALCLTACGGAPKSADASVSAGAGASNTAASAEADAAARESDGDDGNEVIWKVDKNGAQRTDGTP